MGDSQSHGQAEMNLFRASAISTAVLIGASFLPWIDAAHAQRRPFEAPHAEDGVYAVDISIPSPRTAFLNRFISLSLM